jgi:hypothetical protein
VIEHALRYDSAQFSAVLYREHRGGRFGQSIGSRRGRSAIKKTGVVAAVRRTPSADSVRTSRLTYSLQARGC